MSPTKRIIISFKKEQGKEEKINYARRMYAIIRRYAPDVIEGRANECFVELTGLRTHFRMTYSEMVEHIKHDLERELRGTIIASIASVDTFLLYQKTSHKKKETPSIVTYKEMNPLYSPSLLAKHDQKSVVTKTRIRKIRLTIPFLGKVK